MTQDRCTVCAERTIGSEIVLDANDGTPRKWGYVESRFSPFGDGVSVGARLVHGLCQMYHRLRKLVWTHLMVLPGDEAEVKAHFGPLEDSANLDADRCMVCAERTIGSEIILDVPDGTPT